MRVLVLSLTFVGAAAVGAWMWPAASTQAAADEEAPGRAAQALRLGAALGIVALYTRFQGRRALAHPTRGALHARILETPGQDMTALGIGLSLPRAVIRHHLVVIERQGLVVSSRVGRSRRYFPPQMPSGAQAHEDVLRDASRKAIALAVANALSPPSQTDLMGTTDFSRRMVSYHLRILQDARLLESPPGSPRRYVALPRLLTYADGA